MLASRGFFGSGAIKPNLTDRSLVDVNAGASDAEAYVIFGNDGRLTVHTDTAGTGTVSNQWLTGAVSPSEAGLYELVVTLASGSLDYGAAGTFNLGTSRQLGCYVGANDGTASAAVDVQIRRVADSLVMATASLSFHAESSNL
jgi:hypothetical protein